MKSCEKIDVCVIEDIVEDVYDIVFWYLKE